MRDRARAPVWKWRQGAGGQEEIDELAVEEPLEIRVAARPVSVTMRTPGQDEELAVGFLLTEGIITRSADIHSARPIVKKDSCNAINVALTEGVRVDFDRLTRHVFTSSSCGLCGKATIDAVHQQFPPVSSDFQVEATALLAWVTEASSHQANFSRTGGLHAAAVFERNGKLLVLREDVGRHNAVDKVIGHAVLRRILPLDQHVLLVSGRASFEILQKALAARIAVVAAVSAPSSLAVDFAQASGQTLVGFVRAGRLNVYTHPHRIAGTSTQ